MIQVQGVVKSITYDQFTVQVVKDEQAGCPALVCTIPGLEAHVFPLPVEVAEQLEASLREQRGGVQVAKAMPPFGTRNGHPVI